MRILSVQNNSIQQKTNFKSKLPSVNCFYEKGVKDYWPEFTKKCMDEGKADELHALLTILTSNFDKNYLALTTSIRQKYSIRNMEGSKCEVKIYKFGLHENGQIIDTSEPVNANILISHLEEKTSDGKLKNVKKKSLVDSLLEDLKNIITPKTQENIAIYGGNDTKEEQFLKEFRV